MINIEDFRLKTIPFIPAFKHRQDCLVMQDGPCTCGLEEVLEDEAREALKEKPHSREGQGQNKWVLLDYVNIVVHVFQKEVRDFYEIEDIWHDGKFTNYEDLD